MNKKVRRYPLLSSLLIAAATGHSAHAAASDAEPGELDPRKIAEAAVRGMLDELDEHSDFLPPRNYDDLMMSTEGEFGGLGITINVRDHYPTVISPLEGTPSFRLGIRAGDRIVEIDNNPVAKTVTNDDVFRMLRGPAGSTVQVAIQRQEEPELLRFSIERAKIPIESVPYANMVRPGVGYVRIIRFSATIGDELERSISKLRGEGMKSLLLDLRSNSGGLLTQAVGVLDQLVMNWPPSVPPFWSAKTGGDSCSWNGEQFAISGQPVPPFPICLPRVRYRL